MQAAREVSSDSAKLSLASQSRAAEQSRRQSFVAALDHGREVPACIRSDSVVWSLVWCGWCVQRRSPHPRHQRSDLSPSRPLTLTVTARPSISLALLSSLPPSSSPPLRPLQPPPHSAAPVRSSLHRPSLALFLPLCEAATCACLVQLARRNFVRVATLHSTPSAATTARESVPYPSSLSTTARSLSVCLSTAHRSNTTKQTRIAEYTLCRHSRFHHYPSEPPSV